MAHQIFRRAIVGNDKVPEPMRKELRRIKALKQGYELRGRSGWWPALDCRLFTEEDIASIKRELADQFLWEACLPRYTTDGRRYA